MSGFVQGLRRRSASRDAEFQDAMATMGQAAWDDNYPSVRDIHAQRFAPEASPDDHRTYADFMRAAIDVEDYSRVGGTVGNMELTEQIGNVSCPALVLHANREQIHRTNQGRRLAAGIPDARFVGLDTANNLMPVYDPVWSTALREIGSFLDTIEQSSRRSSKASESLQLGSGTWQLERSNPLTQIQLL